MLGMLKRPRPLPILRTSTVRVTPSKARLTCSRDCASLILATARFSGRTWFRYCVLAMLANISTTRASQPVTSRARSSSIAAAPLRRRKRIVLATSARGLSALRGQSIHRPVADQVADIGYDPVGAGLDELIVVQLRQILVQNRDLCGDRGQQRAQRTAVLGVAHPIDGGQQPRQLVNVEAHGLIPASCSGPGSRVSNSAAEAGAVRADLRGRRRQYRDEPLAADTVEPLELGRHSPRSRRGPPELPP